MAKPIFLVGFPVEADSTALGETRTSLNYLLNEEYHVIVYRAQEIQSVQFQVLNAINSTDVEIEELIEKTTLHLKTLNNDDANI